MEEKELIKVINELCARAGKDVDFGQGFYQDLKADEEILEEFVYYMKHGNFACKAKAAGYTVVDILVWQMDHFKARLDRDNSDSRQNRDHMILMAFHTFLAMKKDPGRYIRMMQYETGTDYPDKY